MQRLNTYETKLIFLLKTEYQSNCLLQLKLYEVKIWKPIFTFGCEVNTNTKFLKNIKKHLLGYYSLRQRTCKEGPFGKYDIY